MGQQRNPLIIIRWSVMARRFGKLDLVISISALVLFFSWSQPVPSLRCSAPSGGSFTTTPPPPPPGVENCTDSVTNSVTVALFSPGTLELVSRNFNNTSLVRGRDDLGFGTYLLISLQLVAGLLVTQIDEPGMEDPDDCIFNLNTVRFFSTVTFMTTGIFLTAAYLLGTDLLLGIALGLAVIRGCGLYIVSQYIGELVTASVASKLASQQESEV